MSTFSPALVNSRSSLSLGLGSVGNFSAPVRNASPSHGRTPSIAPAVPFDQAHLLGSLGSAGQHALLAHDKTLDLYRANAKKSQDPVVQFEFAQFLISSAMAMNNASISTPTLSGSAESEIRPVAHDLRKTDSVASAISQNSSQGSTRSSLFSPEDSTSPSTPASSTSSSSSTCSTAMNKTLTASNGKLVNMIRASSSDSTISSGNATVDNAEVAKKREKLLREAAVVLRKLSDRSYPDAQYLLGDALSSGLLGKRDLRESFILFFSAAKHGHAEAAYRAALCYEEGWGTASDPRKAVQLLKASASKNHPGAMLKLGMACYFNQLGLAHKQRDGVRWLVRAADVANEIFPQAPYELAGIYETGFLDVIIPDLSYAAQLYVKSAELGYGPSAARLGHAYEYGELSCPMDPVLSVHYYTVAALAGDSTSMLALCAWYMVGAPPVLERNIVEAYEWAHKAADAGLPKAMLAVGHFCEAGIGTKVDNNKALEWYTRASECGDERGQERLVALQEHLASGINVATAANSSKKAGKKLSSNVKSKKPKSTDASVPTNKKAPSDDKECVIM
ncbi:uncharacterized protein V1516DRAFT_625226 [Lipomyces oligophaga]|uniref:uncharacterized protein n=1 Tax=Lipomyces oligophaga TaxID=45792 RepID=UPI0034CE74E4